MHELARKDGPTQDGGLHVLALTQAAGGGTPDHPRPIAHNWLQDFHGRFTRGTYAGKRPANG